MWLPEHFLFGSEGDILPGLLSHEVVFTPTIPQFWLKNVVKSSIRREDKHHLSLSTTAFLAPIQIALWAVYLQGLWYVDFLHCITLTKIHQMAQTQQLVLGN